MEKKQPEIFKKLPKRVEKIPDGRRLRVVLHTGTGSRVQKHFKEECDINHLLARYNKTGQLPGLIKENPMYGDFSNPLDFQEAQNLIIHANSQFNALSARTRDRFANDPQKFLEFATNPSNREEMAKLGLLNEKALEALKNAKNAASKDTPAPTPEPEPKKKLKKDE